MEMDRAYCKVHLLPADLNLSGLSSKGLHNDDTCPSGINVRLVNLTLQPWTD